MQSNKRKSRGGNNTPLQSTPGHNKPGGFGAQTNKSAKKLVAFEESKGSASKGGSGIQGRASRSRSRRGGTSSHSNQRSSDKSRLSRDLELSSLLQQKMDLEKRIRQFEKRGTPSGSYHGFQQDQKQFSHFTFDHAPGGKICNFCHSKGQQRPECRFLTKQDSPKKIQAQQPRKLLQRPARSSRSTSKPRGPRILGGGLPTPKQASNAMQFDTSDNSLLSKTPDLISQGNQKSFSLNSPSLPDISRQKLFESDQLHHITDIDKVQSLSGDQTSRQELLMHDQELKNGVKRYRQNLANSASDLQAVLTSIQDLSADAVRNNTHEKIFQLPDGNTISVKTHPKPQLSKDIRSLLNVHAGNAGAWFNDKMEFSLDVDPSYRDRCDISSRRWDPIYNDAVHYQMQAYIDQGIVREMEPDESVYGRTPLNVIGAPGQRLRITMDARQINEFFAPPKINLPNVLHPIGLEGEKWYTKVDFSDAFNHIRFTKEFSRWFVFDYQGKQFVWQHMGFGWNMAPAIFQTIVEAVNKHIYNEFQLRSWSFYDDILYCGFSDEDLKPKTAAAVTELQRLGFLVNKDKSVLEPAKSIQFLGFDLDQTGVSVSKEATEAFLILVDAWKQDKTYRLLLQLLGMASWCSIVGRSIPHLTSEINRAIPSSIRADKRLHDQKCSEEVIKASKDLDKLADVFRSGIKFHPKIYDTTYIVYVDASLSGLFGFTCGTSIQQIDASAEEKSRDIDTLEVLAIAKALNKAPSKCNVIVKSDSNVALYSFMRGTSANPELRKIIADIMKMADSRQITFVVQRVKSKENKADRPSREMIPDDRITPWNSFWQKSPLPLTWSQYLTWVQQVHERDPYRDQARSILIMLLTKSLRIHAISILGNKILKENQLFDGDAAKILAAAVLQYLRHHPITQADVEGPQPKIVARIVNRLGAAGALKWHEVQDACEGRISAQLIDQRFLASRSDKLQPPKHFISVLQVGGYAVSSNSEAMQGHSSDYNKKSRKKVERAVRKEKANHDEHMDSPEGSDKGSPDPSKSHIKSNLNALSQKQTRSANLGVFQQWEQRERELQSFIEEQHDDILKLKDEVRCLLLDAQVTAQDNIDRYENNVKVHQEVKDKLLEAQKKESDVRAQLASQKKAEEKLIAEIQRLGALLESSGDLSQEKLQIQTQLKSLQQSEKDAKASLDKEKSHVLRLQQEKKSLEDAANLFKQKCLDLQKDLESQGTSNQLSEKSKKEQQDKSTLLQKQNEDLKGQLASREKTIKDLEQELSRAKTSILQESVQIDLLNHRLEGAHREEEKLKAVEQEVRKKLNNSESKVSNLEKKIQSLKNDSEALLKKTAEDLEAVKESREQFQKQCKALEMKNLEAQKSLTNMQKDASDQSQIINEQEIEIEQLKDQVRELGKSKTKTERRIQDLDHQTAQLHDNLKSSNENSLLLQIRDLNAHLSKIKQQLTMLELENVTLKNEQAQHLWTIKNLMAQADEDNKSRAQVIMDGQTSAQDAKKLQVENRKLVFEVEAQHQQLAAHKKEIEEMSREFSQFLGQAADRDQTIRHFQRFVDALKTKLGGLQYSYQLLCDDFRQQVHTQVLAITDAENLKVQNFLLQKNLSCAQWTMNAQGQLLNHCYQSIQASQEAGHRLAIEFQKLEQSAAVDQSQGLAQVDLNTLKNIVIALPSAQPSIDPNAGQIKEQLERMQSGDPEVQSMAAQTQPIIHPVATTSFVAGVDGSLSEPSQIQHPDRTIAAMLDKGDNFIQRIEELRKQKHDAELIINQVQSKIEEAKSGVAEVAPAMPPMMKTPKTLSRYQSSEPQPSSKLKVKTESPLIQEESKSESGHSSKTKGKKKGK